MAATHTISRPKAKMTSAKGLKTDAPKKAFSILPKESKLIFKSWLLWRIVLAIVVCVLLIQSISLGISIKQLENNHLQEIRKIAHSAVTPLKHAGINPDQGIYINEEAASSIMQAANLKGISIYKKPSSLSGQIELIQSYGKTINMPVLSLKSADKTWRSEDLKDYEFTFQNIIGDNYIIAVKANTDNLQKQLMDYALLHGAKDLGLAAFLTIIVILSISHWLLDPILFMRKNLLEASKNPERPRIEPSPYKETNEIGNAISIAQNLIRQNSLNLQQTKSSAEDKIYKLAYFDTLTKLPNRAFFLQQIERSIVPRMGKPPRHFYVVAIDLDNFKDINDSMGHNVGDLILRNVGKRLKSALPADAIVSRTGEDEFALMIDINATPDPIETIAERVLNIIRNEPFKIFNETLQVKASAGFAAFPTHGHEAEQLVRHADIALNKAKEDGRNTFKEYSEDFEKAIQERFQLLRDLRQAMEEDELVLFYQPQLDLNTGRIIGTEALIRWWKPDDSEQGGQFISPGAFIPAAEQSGLIVPMGEWIIERAIKDAKIWNDTYGFDMRVAINISGEQFEETDLPALTRHMLEKYDLPPHKVELEVTESVFMDDLKKTIATLQELYDMGVELAIDDFGTGYSSLSYLSQFPIHRLKVDQAFVKNSLENPNDASITRTIIALGRSLNLKVIAEGVETREHEEFLIAEGCDEVQGFRYSKPVPNERFIEFCRDYNGDLRSFGRI